METDNIRITQVSPASLATDLVLDALDPIQTIADFVGMINLCFKANVYQDVLLLHIEMEVLYCLFLYKKF